MFQVNNFLVLIGRFDVRNKKLKKYYFDEISSEKYFEK
jgi:hypothetical protein